MGFFAQKFGTATPSTGNFLDQKFAKAPQETAPAQPGMVQGALNTAGGALKGVGNFLTSSEQGTGKDITGAIQGFSGASSEYNKAQGQDIQTHNQIMQEIQSMKAKGQDTSKLQSLLTQQHGVNYSEFNPASTKSNLEVAGDIGGTTADLLTAGTYGKVTAGMKAGELASKSVPTAVKIAGTVAEASKPIIKKGAMVAGDIAKGSANLAKKGAIGKEGLKTLSQIANPEAKKYVAGKSFSEVVKTTQEALSSFIKDSKESLQKVKEMLPSDTGAISKTGLTTGKETFAQKTIEMKNAVQQKVKEAISNSITKNAEYRGTAEEVKGSLRTPKDLINSGLLTSEEIPRVKGILKTVNEWKDFSARGVLNLKEDLDAYYKAGFNTSNSILKNIRNGLKDIVAEVHPEIKPALEKATQDIEKSQAMRKLLIGKDKYSGETKLATLARSLKNPASRQETLNLIQELKSATGKDILPQLEGYADYLELLKKDFPTKAGTITKNIATRLGIGGGIAEGVKILSGH